jgi:hypothetical protein
MLRFRQKTSRRASHDLILAFVRYGNHLNQRDYPTDADVKRQFLRNGIDFDRLVDECRSPDRPVPHYENLIGSTWQTIGSVEVALVDRVTGDEQHVLTGSGLVAPDNCWAIFEGACEDVHRAVAKASYIELQGAIVKGIASLEAFINARVDRWNKAHPEDQLLDSRQNKVSFEDKVDIWIPKLTGGAKLDKSGAMWRHFLALRTIRDDAAIHPKAVGFGISYADLAKNINLFRLGIAGFLFQLHLLFRVTVPRAVIRGMYAPDVEEVEQGAETATRSHA